MAKAEIGGVILAAGAGSRFGGAPKLLALLRGRPILEYAVAAQCAVPAITRVIVVLGSHAEEIAGRVAFGRAEPVVCETWALGQAESLRAGVRALGAVDRVIVTLGDAPSIAPAVIQLFLHAPPRARATYDGQPGHPVVLGAEELRRLETLSGDAGARELLHGGLRIECGPAWAGADIDTPADLAAIRARML